MLRSLAPFNFSDHVAVCAAFSVSESLALIQGWQADPTGLPAFVQLAWHEGRVWALGTLTNADVHLAVNNPRSRLSSCFRRWIGRIVRICISCMLEPFFELNWVSLRRKQAQDAMTEG